jgi:hypothetical protein
MKEEGNPFYGEKHNLDSFKTCRVTLQIDMKTNQVISKFIDDNVSSEVFNFDTLEEAKYHLYNEVNTHIEILTDLEKYLSLALEKAEILNLDISDDIIEILDKLKI